MPSTTLTASRRYLLVALAGLAAGCSGTPGDDGEVAGSTTDVPTATATATEAVPSTASEPALTDEQPGTGRGRRVTIDAVPVTLSRVAREVARPRSAFSSAEDAVLETVIAGEAVTTTTDVDARFDSPLYVRSEGQYYRVERTVHAERERTGQQFRLHTLSCDRRTATTEESARATGDTVAFSDLPRVDRAAFPAFVREPMERAECFEAGWTHSYPDAAARDSSRLLGSGPTYVSVDGRDYRVDHLGENTVTEREYRYTATAVADSSAAFEAVVDEQVVTHLDARALSAGEAEALRTVLDRGEVSWDRPVPPAVDGLAAQLDGERYVEWESEYYEVEVRELVS